MPIDAPEPIGVDLLRGSYRGHGPMCIGRISEEYLRRLPGARRDSRWSVLERKTRRWMVS